MSKSIAEIFDHLRAARQLAFMPFMTAGDPDLNATRATLLALADSGVDLIEVGFPYSDPIADGPVIQASYTRALDRQLRVTQIFDTLGDLKSNGLPPLIAMVSYAIIFRWGVDHFLAKCVDAGIAGLIVPDLPGAEAADLFQQTQAKGLSLVQLIAPTTPRERVKQILQACSGFVYVIAVAGTTGEREQVAEALLEQLRWLREETGLPLVVGFGISRPEHVEPLRGLADGVIVGSAIVRYLEKMDAAQSPEPILPDLREYAKLMTSAAHQPG